MPWIERYQRPSTLKGDTRVWKQHLRTAKGGPGELSCESVWLKDTRTHHVQSWLNAIAKSGTLSRNSLKRIQSTLGGIFSLAKQLGYFEGVNPVQDTRIDPTAAEPAETYAYSLEEVQSLLALLPEPAATAFAVAAFMGLRIGEGSLEMGGLPRRRDAHLSLDLERPHRCTQDAEIGRASAGDSPAR
jgi:DNA-directed RNA polymerase specialized sigma24 family protein